MREDLAAVNVTRTYTLAASNIAIFTFLLFFLYRRVNRRKMPMKTRLSLPK